ncbi:MAG: alpha/beta hydrolase [Alkalinema sp. RU_4_3]|nr:alpha/beta hydrolase [Alkalinema sp. RU_4_3]
MISLGAMPGRAIAVLLGLALTALPGQAAERLTLSYGLLERSITLQTLEKYANSGELDNDLSVYTSYVKSEQRDQLRKALSLKSDLSPVAVSQFLYSPQGDILLKRLGQLIQPESRDNGSLAIRAALILAADDPEGLTPLNVLRRFPTRGIRVDLQKTLALVGELDAIVGRTNRVSKAIAKQADAEAIAAPLTNPALMAKLANRGKQIVRKQTLNLVDNGRVTVTGFVKPRAFSADLYLPSGRQSRKLPLIVISHGLGSNLTTFQYLAEHLASHGFAVAMPEHTGSNTKQMQALVSGLAAEAATPSEFVDRPLDVKFLLDELGRRGFGTLDLTRVGMLGQSFGGYTSLALSGAPINFSRLEEACTTEKQVNTFNISLLLQCRAGTLPKKDYNLSDPRIAASLAINPITSVVLGEAGLQRVKVPTMIVTGNADTVAPALPEQIVPFSWLGSQDRYLVQVDRSTHFSFLGEEEKGNDPLPVPTEVLGPTPEVTRQYMRALSVAFFRTHLLNQPGFRQYLTAAYGRAITQDPLRVDIIKSIDGGILKGDRSQDWVLALAEP